MPICPTLTTSLSASALYLLGLLSASAAVQVPQKLYLSYVYPHRQEDDFLSRLFFVRRALVQRVAPRQTCLRKAVLLSQLLVFVKRLSLKIDFQTSFVKHKQSPIVPPFARSALGFCRRSSPAKIRGISVVSVVSVVRVVRGGAP